MKIPRLALFFIAMLFSGACCAQSVALTFDDPKDPAQDGQQGISAQILDTLRARKLKSTLFVCGMRVDTPSGIDALKAWQAAGHELANHTYSHLNLSGRNVTTEQFIADADRNDAFLRRNALAAVRFRFPYLKEGNTEDKRDRLRAWMKQKKYRSGAVSIDASDWYYDQRYATWQAKHPGADDTPFKDAYLAHLWDRARYYDGLSKKHLGRSIPHTLLLHLNRINARFLPDIIDMFKAKGWTVIDSRTAYEDAAYQATPDVMPAGESLLWQVAKAAGDPTLRYPGEDQPYEEPILDKLGL